MIGTKAMKELSNLKRELKCWENMFERTHGRKPNKDDINSGPAEIKESYRRYRLLKESASKTDTESCKQDGDDEVFGRNLNKKVEDIKLSSLPFRAKQWADITPIRLCHGQGPKKQDDTPAKKDDSVQNDDPDKKDSKISSVENTENDSAMCIDHNFQDVKVIDTSQHKITSFSQNTISSSLLCSGHQSRNVRGKKRGSISSAWLQKYKPELPEDTENIKPHSEKSVENKSDSFDVFADEKMVTVEKKNLDGENNTLSTTEQSEVSCISDGNKDIFENSTAEERDGRKKKTEINFKTSNLVSAEEGSCKVDNKTENAVTSKSKAREAKKCSDEEPPSKVSDRQAALSKSCTSASVNIANPVVSSKSEKDMEMAPVEDFRDSPQDVIRNKRKADKEVVELEKPHKKLRCDDDNEDNIAEESNVENIDDEDLEEEDLSQETSKQKASHQSSNSKVSSGLVSDNFQRLNMKHRSYRRRGGGISGSAHKRRAWKQMMKSRGEFVPQKSWSSKGRGGGGGAGKSGACFKCGQEGHWAKNCRGPKKHSSSLGSSVKSCEQEADDVEMEEFEPLPSIEEAALMAAGIQQNDAEQSEGLVILPHQLPRPVYTPPSPPPAVEPLYQPVDCKPVDVTKEVLSSLEKLGFSSFRPGQQEAVMRILCGLSSLVVLSTGAGKSLCYQLPAFLYANRSSCLTLVISPLVSLMEDQITGLPLGLKGACLHTNQSKAQRQKIVEDLCSGKVSVLLLSPEALVGGSSGNGCLPSVTQLPQIAFACIDEAHCVSEWSHNFRPSYLRVCKVLREKFGVRCFLGLTATATRATASSVAEHLGIVHDAGAVIRGGAVPPNLFLSVSRDSDRTQALLQLLQGRRFSQCDSIIIYCTRREQTEKLASTLRTCLQSTRLSSGWNGQDEPRDEEEEEETGKKKKKTKGKGNKKSSKATVPKWDAECYHAGLTAAQRRRVQKRFMTGQLRIVVATVAFGMGLDKSDVRAIIHFNLPRSFESYVQEIGRAGRDGRPSHCHVFLDPEGKDMCELRRHVYANTVDRSVIKKLVKRAFPRCECKKLHEQQRNANQRNENEFVDLEEECGDALDSNLEAELQAVELQYQKEVETQAQDDKEGTERAESFDSDPNIDQKCSDPSESTPLENGNSETSTSTPGVQSSLKSESLSESSSDAKIEKDLYSETIEPTDNSEKQPLEENSVRFCGGHEVAMVTESIVQELDMREESIATLLCYLELHPRRWLEVLQPVKSTCTLKFYGGYPQLRAVAKKIPPVAAAVSHTSTTPAAFKRSSTLSFNAVELADKMGWDLSPVCRELRALQWNTSLSLDDSLSNMGQSGILVEFCDLSMHHRAPGDLTDSERDSVCDFLEDRIQAEEKSQLQQLQFVYDSLKSVSFSEFWQCADAVDEESDSQIKQIVRSYFEDCNDKTKEELAALSKARKGSRKIPSSLTRDDHVNWDGVARDIRALLGVHHDHSFTGRAVARIFHGIDSPCYPAEVWGRDRRFWRKHLDVEFNSLRKFATQELIRFR